MKPQIKNSILFEIGAEEIPSGYFGPASASVLSQAAPLLAECGYLCEGTAVYTTPRRLVIEMRGLTSIAGSEEEKTGPSKAIAFQDGRPTVALEGFLKSTGKSIQDVYFKQTARGECVCVKIHKKFRPLRDFFETLPALIEFPKVMRWDETRYSFTRPIRWTFAFLGNRVQQYRIGGILSSDWTMGHRFLSNRKLKVRNSDIADFKALLARHHVMLDDSARADKIRSFLKRYRNTNEELIRTVSHLVEDPFPVVSRFPKEYLKLPPAVLETCMSKQLKVFSCYDASGKLDNRFLVIANGARRDSKVIAKNYERVLCARLKDAQFFFGEDTKTALASKVKKLKDMVFLGTLGSYRDKTLRLEKAVDFLGHAAGIDAAVIERSRRAAHLAKADLTTHLVYEFPELQGLAGAEYARHDKEPFEVSKAIAGHYLPGNLTQDFRELKKMMNPETILLALADRMDLLVGAIGIGIEVSGSQDPYALRRSAGGIAKILRAHPIPVSLKKWVEDAYQLFGGALKADVETVRRKVTDFLRDRIAGELQVRTGTREHELLCGIFASDCDDIGVVYQKFAALVKHVQDPVFETACKVLQRPYRILKGLDCNIADSVNADLFQDDLERKLYQLVLKHGPEISGLAGSGDYWQATRVYAGNFCETLHAFFDKVKVNAEDERIRSNRQSLMKQVFRIYTEQVADLSFITNLSSM